MVGSVRIAYLCAAFSCLFSLVLFSAVPAQIGGIVAKDAKSNTSCESLENRKDSLRQKFLALERSTRSDDFSSAISFGKLLTRLERVNKRFIKAKNAYLQLCLGEDPFNTTFIEGSSVSENMLTNPGFESNLAGWQFTAGATSVPAPVHGGQGALKITASRKKAQQTQQDLAVVPQANYYAAVWVLNPGNAPLYVSVNWYNAQVSAKGNTLANLINTVELKLNALASGTEWKLYDGSLFAPADAVTGRLRFMTPKTQTEPGVYFDDAVIGLNTLPPTVAPTAAPTNTSTPSGPAATHTISPDPTLSPAATPTATVPFLPTLMPTRTHTRVPTGTIVATPTPGGNSTSFIFSAVGDYDYNFSGVNETLQAIAGMGASFNLALGDFSYGGATETAWCDFVKSYVGSAFPFELLSGDHEDGTHNAGDGLIENFAACLPDRLGNISGEYGKQYYFDYPAAQPLARFIQISPGLSFLNGGVYDYSAGTARYNWTASAIDSARAAGIPWIIVSTHRNCISTGEKTCDIGEDIFNLLVSKKVDLLLQANDHNYQRSKQLALNAGSCAGINAGAYNQACVVDDGQDNSYMKGQGTVLVVSGIASITLKPINTSDAENGYFVRWMGSNINPTSGTVKFTVSQTQISAQVVPAYGGNFSDSFSIGGSTPPVPTAACTHYVSTGGTAANPGTEAAPWTLTRAAAAAVAGNVVCIKAGTYAQAIIPASSGTSDSPITFRAHGDGPVLITGLSRAIDVSNRSYIVIDELNIDNTQWLEGVNSHHITLHGNRFTRSTAAGTTGNVRFVTSHHIKVLNNVLDDGNDNLIMIDSDNNLVEGNRITKGRHTAWAFKCGNFNVIRNNYFSNPDQKIGEIYDCDSIGAFGLVQTNAAHHNLVEGNIFDTTPLDDGGGPYAAIQYSGQEGVMRFNTVYNTQGGTFDLTNYGGEAEYTYSNRIFNNTFYANACGGALTSSNSGDPNFADNLFKNNIYFQNRNCGSFRFGTVSGEEITNRTNNGFRFERNNIFHNTAGERVISINNQILSLSGAQSGFPSHYSNNLELSPAFVDAAAHDFHLQAGSPMIDEGAFLTTVLSAGSGTSLPVADAKYFYDGFAIEGEVGDLIQLEGQSTRARVTQVDFATNTLVLDTALTWSAGQGVALAYSGTKPDLGMFEYTASGSSPPPPVTPTSVPPAASTPTPTATANAPVPTPTLGGGGSLAAPLGIPEPSFGVMETHRMYQGQRFDFDNDGLLEAGEEYKDAGGGPYTHYVRTGAGCADSNNQYGTTLQPRCSIPLGLRAGSVIELHGGPYSNGNLYGGTEIGIQGAGSSTQPVFVRGVPGEAKPRFTKSIEVTGSYVIVENLDVDFAGEVSGSVRLATPLRYAAFRHSLVHHGAPSYNSAISVAGDSLTNRPEHVVVLGNSVYENGDWLGGVERDYRGVGVGPAQNIWVLENLLWHNDSDGVGLNAGYGSSNLLINRIFVGRNIAWENRQGGFWTKEASDVVFSENVAFAHKVNGPGGTGHGMGWQYSPDRVWLLFNRIYDNTNGIGPGGTDSEDLAFYLIGNYIYNNVEKGITIYNNGHVTMLNNTVVNNPAGGIDTFNGTNYVVNNLVENGIIDDNGNMLERHHNLELSEVDSQFMNIDGADNIPGTGDDEFYLRSTSVAVEAGAAHTAYETYQQLYGVDIRRDPARISRPQGSAWDIGAFEFVGGS